MEASSSPVTSYRVPTAPGPERPMARFGPPLRRSLQRLYGRFRQAVRDRRNAPTPKVPAITAEEIRADLEYGRR